MSHPITGLLVVVPSTVAVGESFELRVKLLCDAYPAPWMCKYYSHVSVGGPFNLSPRGITYLDNTPPEWDGAVELDGGDGYAGPAQIAFAEGAGPYPNDRRPIRRIEGLSFKHPGTAAVTVRDPESGARSRRWPPAMLR